MTFAQETPRADAGFAMAALLVALAVMAVVMTALLPVWRTMAVRDKEAELLWRGQQYDRAIQLYRRKNAAPGTPSIDALIQGKFLRKRYKDPITGTDFDLVGVNAGIANAPGVQQPALGVGQLIGSVKSRSKATSFLEPDGATTYDQWKFTYVPWKPAGPTTPGGTSGSGTPGGLPTFGGSGGGPGSGNNRGTGQRNGGSGPGRREGSGPTRGPGSGLALPRPPAGSESTGEPPQGQ